MKTITHLAAVLAVLVVPALGAVKYHVQSFAEDGCKGKLVLDEHREIRVVTSMGETTWTGTTEDLSSQPQSIQFRIEDTDRTARAVVMFANTSPWTSVPTATILVPYDTLGNDWRCVNRGTSPANGVGDAKYAFVYNLFETN